VRIPKSANQRQCEAGPSAVAANRNVRSWGILVPQKTPRRQCVIVRRWERMFWRKSISNSQCAHAGGSTCLSDQTTVTQN
jgi:hypothetical protein